MSPTFFALAVLGCLLFGTLAGVRLGTLLPEHHLNHESRDAVKLGIGLVATMTALVLGLVTASAKSFFDTQESSVKQCAAEVLSLDRLLARYGPETKDIRDQISQLVAERMAGTWPESGVKPKKIDKFETTPEVEY